MTPSNITDGKSQWYKDAIIYELHVRAFRDGNGDGIGDFQGLLEKLDHFEELGVTAIWILPFYPSPLKDDGYDIADYYSINSSYGNIKWFRKLLKEAHKRNLKIITELVLNHTSDQHEWFQRAKKAPKGSPQRNYYVWSDDPSVYKDVRIIFQDFESSNWTWDDEAQQYYWHRFFHHQPDLNYDNPGVQEEVFKIIDYWCKIGVDGFRLDAVPYLFEREGTNGENLPETHQFLRKLREHVDKHYPGTLLLAEANMWPEDAVSYFGHGDECHMNFHFPLMPRMFMAIQMEDKYPIIDIFEQTPQIPQNCQWALFLRNHDELTLEMVTDEERDYMYRTYVRDPKAKINLGIRHRLAPLMENDRRKIELMNSLLFSMPGTPVIYYGDEIGMGDNFYLGDRDGVRTPMQWSPDRNAGFSDANPQLLYLPLILDPSYHYETINVEIQRTNTSSFFWYMKRIINTRKKHRAFGRGDMKFMNVENPKVLVFTRSFGDETILVIANLSKFSQPAEVDLAAFTGYIPVEIFSKNHFPAVKKGIPYFFTLGPYSFQWFILNPSDEIPDKKKSLPYLQNHSWKEILEGNTKKILEGSIIPSYLVRTNWYTGIQRMIYSCSITDHFNITAEGIDISLLLVEINYKSGLPETYQLPLAFLPNNKADAIMQQFPQAVLAEVSLGKEVGVLCDAWYIEQLQRWLFQNMVDGKKMSDKKQQLVFSGNAGLKNRKQAGPVRPRIHSAVGQSNTAVVYNSSFFLKIYRKIDIGEHPDLETSRYLSERSAFCHTPQYYGSIIWKGSKGSRTIGMMQELVENNGDGYTYMLERMNNYLERVLAIKKTDLPDGPSVGSLFNPVEFDELPKKLQVLLGPRTAREAILLGKRIGEMHLLLANADTKDFIPERFSLHYQRSLFSTVHSLLRETYTNLSKFKRKLPVDHQNEVEKLLIRKSEVNSRLKRIYIKKIDVIKTRIHGNLSLRQVLLTSKDVSIHDFGGNPSRYYSERKLKRSPLRDLASMIHSFYYVALEGLFIHAHVPPSEFGKFLPYAELWAHYISGFFTGSYLNTIGESDIVPKGKDDLAIMVETFLTERTLDTLNFEIQNKRDLSIISITLLKSILK
jgi:maltose alpha-D-glucosyltransferase / alpha-amylase